MKVQKIFKRFLKENGIYGSNKAKEILEFFDDYEEPYIPFNAFRWDTTDEGHNYWYDKSMLWAIYLFNNLGNIDTDEHITADKIMDVSYELLKYFCLDTDDEKTLMKMDSYTNLDKLYNSLKNK